MLQRRVTELGDVPEALARAGCGGARAARAAGAVERTAEEERTVWVRERQYAETKRTELLKQYEEVKEQRDQIVKLGPEGTCPTCKRPLGRIRERARAARCSARGDHRGRESISGSGSSSSRNRPPSCWMRRPSETACSRKTAAPVLGRGSCGRRSRNAIAPARSSRRARRRAGDLERQLTARPGGYDAARHDAVRAELAKLEPVALEAAALEERARRAERLVQEAEQAEQQLSTGERRVRELTEAVRAEGFSDAEYRQAKDRYDRAVGALREAELAVVEARGELNRAEDDLAEAKRRAAERAQRERQIAVLKARQRLHNELDRASRTCGAS